jgi:hypothetical protein
MNDTYIIASLAFTWVKACVDHQVQTLVKDSTGTDKAEFSHWSFAFEWHLHRITASPIYQWRLQE